MGSRGKSGEISGKSGKSVKIGKIGGPIGEIWCESGGKAGKSGRIWEVIPSVLGMGLTAVVQMGPKAHMESGCAHLWGTCLGSGPSYGFHA